MTRLFRTVLLSFAMLLAAQAAFARNLVRDPDIEYSLKELAKPLIAAAGLSAARIDVLVIQDDAMNAFIVDDRAVFLNSGLILRAKSAAELQAVIAHELAHIANGHIARRRSNARAAGRTAAVGMALGLAAALSGEGALAGGVAAGVSSSAQGAFLGHTRAEEAAADASGLRYMAEAGIDPRAAATMLDTFRGQEVLSASRQDPYVRAHPLTRDRLRAVQGLAAGLRVAERDTRAADYWFARAHGKLSAFVRNPGWTLKQTKNGASDIAVLRRAVAYHRRPDPARARQEIDRLAAMRPNDPFVHELRGQILLESRDVGGAVGAYRRAVDIMPSHPLLLAGYGRALLAAGRHGDALPVLRKAHDRDPRDTRLLRDLSIAYAKAGNNGQASLVTAERYAMSGRPKDAVIHAQRAAGALPAGSPGRRRAEDILATMAER